MGGGGLPMKGMDEMDKNYFVSYAHNRGFGSAEFNGVKEPISWHMLQYWKEKIQKSMEVNEASIMFFTEIAPSKEKET